MVERPSLAANLMAWPNAIIRAAILATLLVSVGAGYVLLLGAPVGDLPQERALTSPLTGKARLRLYLELVDVDVIRDSMQVKVSVESDGPTMLPDRNLAVILAHDMVRERIEVRAQQPVPTQAVELHLYGADVTTYPLDAYSAELSIRCFETDDAASAAEPKLLPIDVVMWERVLGFRLRTTLAPASAVGEVALHVDVQRGHSFIVFALVAYGSMLILACGALTISLLVLFRARRAEPTLVGALGAIVFALPALRGTLPATAPLGVAADVLVFLWAEVAAVAALAMLVATWARTGPRP